MTKTTGPVDMNQTPEYLVLATDQGNTINVKINASQADAAAIVTILASFICGKNKVLVHDLCKEIEWAVLGAATDEEQEENQ